MRVNCINNLNFQRRLTSSEAKDVNGLHPKIQTALGHTGQNILIVHDPCLPVKPEKDMGIGYLLSDMGMKFLNDIKTLLGITAVEVHPQGEYYVSKRSGFCCPYSGTALSLGAHIIPPEVLLQEDFGKLLSKGDINSLYELNNSFENQKFVNFEKFVTKDSPFERVLRKAFLNFQNLDKNSGLMQKFKTYCLNNADWLEPMGVYDALVNKYKNNSKYWTELDRNLFNPDYNSSFKENRLKQIMSEGQEEIEFFKFKQFMAEKVLAKSKEKLNNLGLKLTGDCLIGFSEAEKFAFPKAFVKDKSIGWGLPALDYDSIWDANSPAAKLLKRKVELFAKRYDSIRFDVAWAYLNPAIKDLNTGKTEHRHLKTDAILRMIENTVLSVKGRDFDLKNLIYEFEASGEDFPLDKFNREFIKNRTKVYSMQYMSRQWGHTPAFVNFFDFPKESLLVGLGNQDVLPIKVFAEIKELDFSKVEPDEKYKILSDTFGCDINRLKSSFELSENLTRRYHDLYSLKMVQAEILSEKYNIPIEELINSPTEFAKVKAAEAFVSPNSMFYYMDVLGRSDILDSQDFNGIKNYRYRISSDYLKEYNNAVSKGFGVNMFDIYEKRFKVLGLDKKYPELFSKIQKYNKIIQEPEINAIAKNNKFKVMICSGALLCLTALILFMRKTGEIKNKSSH